MPRQVVCWCSKHLTSGVVTGSRVVVTGVYSIDKSAGKRKREESGGLRKPFVQVVGFQMESDSLSSLISFTPEEEDLFLQFAKSGQAYSKIWQSIAPQIYGHENIKKALACLLFGGSAGVLPDGGKLRGDINVLLMGDPGTAKSQFLKYISRVAPIAVYTSGKSSSAAGLTASVIRDPRTRQFYLEGGAMVLADRFVPKKHIFPFFSEKRMYNFFWM